MGRKDQNKANGFKPGNTYHIQEAKPGASNGSDGFDGSDGSEDPTATHVPVIIKRMDTGEFHNHVHSRDGMLFETDPDNHPILDPKPLQSIRKAEHTYLKVVRSE